MRKICVWALLLMLLACLAGAALSEEAVPVEFGTLKPGDQTDDVAALQEKLFEDMPEDDRIQAFLEAHPDKTAKVPARDLWVWHNRLTGSCELGRNQFARDRGIDIDNDSFTPVEFCEMCRDHYGGDVIRRLEDRLKQEDEE